MDEVQYKMDLAGFAKIVIKELRAHGDRRSISYDDERGCLRFQKAGKYDRNVYLSNFYDEYRAIARNDRDGWLRRTVVDILNRMELPENFEDVKPDLLLAIRSTSLLEYLRFKADDQGKTCSIELASMPVSEHLVACLVYDMPNSMQFVTRHRVTTC